VLPNPQYSPVGSPQGAIYHSVAGDVPGEFVFPKCTIAFGRTITPRAAVPETAVHKYHKFEFWKNEVRLAEDLLIPPPAGDAGGF
jgi:hypothetical protein